MLIHPKWLKCELPFMDLLTSVQELKSGFKSSRFIQFRNEQFGLKDKVWKDNWILIRKCVKVSPLCYRTLSNKVKRFMVSEWFIWLRWFIDLKCIKNQLSKVHRTIRKQGNEANIECIVELKIIRIKDVVDFSYSQQKKL